MRSSAPASDPLPVMFFMAAAVLLHIISRVVAGEFHRLFTDAVIVASVIAVAHALLKLHRGRSPE